MAMKFDSCRWLRGKMELVIRCEIHLSFPPWTRETWAPCPLYVFVIADAQSRLPTSTVLVASSSSSGMFLSQRCCL